MFFFPAMYRLCTASDLRLPSVAVGPQKIPTLNSPSNKPATVDDANPALPHKKECAIIPIVWGP